VCVGYPSSNFIRTKVTNDIASDINIDIMPRTTNKEVNRKTCTNKENTVTGVGEHPQYQRDSSDLEF
jgi:hypothetical protein